MVIVADLEPALRHNRSTRDTAWRSTLSPPSSNDDRIRNSVGPIFSILCWSRGVPPSSGIDHEISWAIAESETRQASTRKTPAVADFAPLERHGFIHRMLAPPPSL
jgi:hypothetical protein